MNLLVTGGAGYIGSHTCHLLSQHGYKLIVLDDLSSGQQKALPEGTKFIQGDFSDSEILSQIFTEKKIDAVLHFAAFIDVAISVSDPMSYYENNFVKTKQLLEVMIRFNVSKLIFSSTACVYKTTTEPAKETHLISPESPYGRSKMMCEWMIQSLAKSTPNFNYIVFRYFNVAGAEPDNSNGQLNPNANHLIKRGVMAATGQIQDFSIFGSDYDTPDGTCIRDYIHVKDLALAHLKALEYLKTNQKSQTLNCGYSQGYSVKQVIDVIQKISSKPIKIHNGPRRPGDIPQSIADNKKILEILKWKPEYNNLEQICQSALNWELKLLKEKINS